MHVAAEYEDMCGVIGSDFGDARGWPRDIMHYLYATKLAFWQNLNELNKDRGLAE